MNTLRLLAPGYFLDERAVQIVLQSFAKFYHQLTAKHQRRLRFYLIEEQDYIAAIRRYSEELDLAGALIIISRNDIAEVETTYQKSDFFIYLSTKNQYRIITEALQFKLPVIVLKSEVTKELLDSTCSMQVGPEPNFDLIEQCAIQLEMLYYDREGCKFLKKGAIKKQNTLFGGVRTIT